MTRSTLEWLLKLHLVACIGSLPAPTPSPSPSPTPTPSPSPATTTSLATTTTTTTSTRLISFTVRLSVEMTTLEGVTEDSLVQKLEQGMTVAAISAANVSAVIHSIIVTTAYGGLPQIFSYDIIQAIVAMNAVPASWVEVNGQKNTRRLLRRLQAHIASVRTTIPNMDGVEVVTKSRSVMTSHGATQFKNALLNVNTATYIDVMPTMIDNPTATVNATVTVIGSESKTLVAADVASAVSDIVGGDVYVQGINSAVFTIHTSTSWQETTSTKTLRFYASEQMCAHMAPMMTVWALIYAFVTN